MFLIFKNKIKKLLPIICLIVAFSSISAISYADTSLLDEVRQDKSKVDYSGTTKNGNADIDAYAKDLGLTAKQTQALKDDLNPKIAVLNSSLNKDKLKELSGPMAEFIKLYGELFKYLTAFGALSSFLVFIVKMVQLSTPGDHPTLRRKLMMDTLVCFFCTAAIGGFSIFYNLFYQPFANILDNQVYLVGDWRLSFTIMLIEYRRIIIGVLGCATLAMILMFILNFIKLGTAAADNPQARKKVMGSLMATGMATAGLGSVSLLVGLFYSFLL